jgi:hypothetical protein
MVAREHALRIGVVALAAGVLAPGPRARAATREVCMGDLHTCARVGDQVACWGDNVQHQITAGDEPQIERPRLLPEVAGAREVRCGSFETCVLKASGDVHCWGARPGVESLHLPRPARELRLHARGGCVQLDDGRVGCWQRPAPSGTRTFVEIEGGVSFAPPSGRDEVCVNRAGGAAPLCFAGASPAHACASQGETIACKGAASHGQLGAGPSYIHALPVMVPGLTDATALEASTSEACAARRAGVRVCWGQHVGPDGRVERASFAPHEAPRNALGAGPGPLAGLGVKTRQLATDQRCGVDGARRLVCGIRSVTSTRPGAAHLWTAPSKERFAAAAALTYDRQRPVACGRTEGGHVACFRVDETATGKPISSTTIDSLAGVVELEAGGLGDDGLTCARDSAGGVSCWGDGRYGQLGTAPPADPFTAVRVANLPAAVQLAVGGTFACARTADGHVWCWGSNRDGAAPTGAPGAEAAPVTVTWPPR